ncbi:hypothetical protein CMV_025920 [Castanea mollissima]|uniref:Uncharacterized protein n=1 Tax=Castanea mollissima TaxID=60419 RepID=A0A8J4QDD2_9ROSI|nr:hypothetical protein CMV_025920 [Castanea mollissima]
MAAGSILYKLQLGLAPDFKFELLPLHSPLLGQSLLVSFPPLIDMLKFSGYPYLIRGQPGVLRWGSPGGTLRGGILLRSGDKARRVAFEGRSARRDDPHDQVNLRVATTLGQTCPPENRGAQCAFKDSMIHTIPKKGCSISRGREPARATEYGRQREERRGHCCRPNLLMILPQRPPLADRARGQRPTHCHNSGRPGRKSQRGLAPEGARPREDTPESLVRSVAIGKQSSEQRSAIRVNDWTSSGYDQTLHRGG